MKLEEHEERSRILFGKKHTEVHIFLDQYFAMFGPYHRIVLHHQIGVNLVVAKFSDSVRKVAEQHIIDDLGQVPDDWRNGFDFDLDYADTFLAKKTALKKGDSASSSESTLGATARRRSQRDRSSSGTDDDSGDPSRGEKGGIA